MTFTLAPDLAPVVQPAALVVDGVTVVERDGRLTLADRLGPFGNPSSDSLRTMVTTETTRAMAVIFAPRALPVDAVVWALDLTSERTRTYAGGVERQRFII